MFIENIKPSNWLNVIKPRPISAYPTLPSRGVLDAVRHRPNSELKLKEIGYLMDSGFPDQATRYLLKALNHDPLQQKQLLEQYVGAIIQDPEDASCLREAIRQSDSNLSVSAEEVSWIGLHGAELWDDLAQKTAIEVQQTQQTPVLLAYGALTGLRHMITALKDTKPVYIFNPKSFRTDTTPLCGFRIDLQNDNSVHFLPKDFERPNDFVLIDDTLDTGKSIQEAWSVWHRDNSPVDMQNVAIFQDRLKPPMSASLSG